MKRFEALRPIVVVSIDQSERPGDGFAGAPECVSRAPGLFPSIRDRIAVRKSIQLLMDIGGVQVWKSLFHAGLQV